MPVRGLGIPDPRAGGRPGRTDLTEPRCAVWHPTGARTPLRGGDGEIPTHAGRRFMTRMRTPVRPGGDCRRRRTLVGATRRAPRRRPHSTDREPVAGAVDASLRPVAGPDASQVTVGLIESVAGRLMEERTLLPGFGCRLAPAAAPLFAGRRRRLGPSPDEGLVVLYLRPGRAVHSAPGDSQEGDRARCQMPEAFHAHALEPCRKIVVEDEKHQGSWVLTLSGLQPLAAEAGSLPSHEHGWRAGVARPACSSSHAVLECADCGVRPRP